MAKQYVQEMTLPGYEPRRCPRCGANKWELSLLGDGTLRCRSCDYYLEADEYMNPTTPGVLHALTLAFREAGMFDAANDIAGLAAGVEACVFSHGLLLLYGNLHRLLPDAAVTLIKRSVIGAAR